MNWLLSVSGGIVVLLLTGSYYYTYSADRDQNVEKQQWRQGHTEELRSEVKTMKENQQRIEQQQQQLKNEVTEKATRIETKLDLLIEIQRAQPQKGR